MMRTRAVPVLRVGSLLFLVCCVTACRNVERQAEAYQVAQRWIDTSSAVHAFFVDFAGGRYSLQELFNPGIRPYDTATTEVAGPEFVKELRDLYCQSHGCSDSERVLLGRSLYKRELKRFENRQKIPIGHVFAAVADTSSRIVVYYSPVYGDTLFAQILLVNPGYPYDHLRWVMRFNTSMKLVFIFDERRNIRDVAVGRIFYD
jgi:hypothetical protein